MEGPQIREISPLRVMFSARLAYLVATGVAWGAKSDRIDVNACYRQYRLSLSGLQSRPENWPCFQRSHVCTYVAMSCVKSFSDPPRAFNSIIIQTIFSAVGQ